jgi:hypothetical protein
LPEKLRGGIDMADKEMKCPWCSSLGRPRLKITKRGGGDVAERICSKCNQVIAAYLATEGDFLPKIRVFENDYMEGDK